MESSQYLSLEGCTPAKMAAGTAITRMFQGLKENMNEACNETIHAH